MNLGRKLTVMQLLPALESGGVERGTVEISRALREQGYESIVVSAGGQLVTELNEMGAEHISWEIGKKSLITLKYVYKLRKYLLSRKVDILHARSRLPAWIGWLAWKSLPKDKRPHFVTTVHGLYSVKKYSSIMTWGEQVIAVSDTAKKYITDNYPEVDNSKISVINRGVDPLQFPYDYKPGETWLAVWYEQYPQLRDRKVITLPGRLTRLKGHEDFIALMSKLRKKGVDVYGLIVGAEDPHRLAYRDEIKSKIRNADLQDRIILTGHRGDIREVYAVSDIILSLSSKPESFGRTTLEALSMGVPVVGYDHGGVGEILRNIYPQGCVHTHMVHDLADKVMSLLDNAPPVSQNHPYQLENMLTETLELYANLANDMPSSVNVV